MKKSQRMFVIGVVILATSCLSALVLALFIASGGKLLTQEETARDTLVNIALVVLFVGMPVLGVSFLTVGAAMGVWERRSAHKEIVAKGVIPPVTDQHERLVTTTPKPPPDFGMKFNALIRKRVAILGCAMLAMIIETAIVISPSGLLGYYNRVTETEKQGLHPCPVCGRPAEPVQYTEWPSNEVVVRYYHPEHAPVVIRQGDLFDSVSEKFFWGVISYFFGIFGSGFALIAIRDRNWIIFDERSQTIPFYMIATTFATFVGASFWLFGKWV
jgi:hypothetical protein